MIQRLLHALAKVFSDKHSADDELAEGMEKALAGPSRGFLSLWMSEEEEVDYAGYDAIAVSFKDDVLIGTMAVTFPTAASTASKPVTLIKLHKVVGDELEFVMNIDLTGNPLHVIAGISPVVTFNEPVFS